MRRYFSQANYENSSSNPHEDSCLTITTQGNRSQFTTPDNTSNLPLPGRKSQLNTPHSNPKLPTRQASEKARAGCQPINIEEPFPDFSQGIADDFSHPPASLPIRKELMPGVFQQGTPVSSPHVKKPRASRFVSASHARDNSTQVEVPIVDDITPQLDVKKLRGSRFGSTSHSRDASLRFEPLVEEVPPPFDQKKVLASLDFLEKKVAALEKNRVQDEITIQQLQLENRVSRVGSKECKKVRRIDSALGSTDGGSEPGVEMSRSQLKLMVEKNRLEASVGKLQEQINVLNLAASESEVNLHKITQDRDSAVSQLGVAYFTIDQFKAEIQTLQERNSMLNRSVNELIANQDDTTMNMTAREEALDREYERREHVEAKEKELEQLKLKKPLVTSLPDLKTELRPKKTALESETLRKGQVTRSGSISSELGNADNTDSTRDLTFLSVVSAGEIGELRKTLEIERVARSKKRNSLRQASKTDVMVEEHTSDERPQQLTATSKSPTIEPIDLQVSKAASMIAKASSDDRSQRLEPTRKSSENEPDRRHEDTPVMSTEIRSCNDTRGKMSSDSINNEIVLEFSGYEGRRPPTPSEEAQISDFEDLPPVSTRRVEQESTDIHKQPKVLSKPVPAVKKTAKPIPTEEDHTLRPSQPPPLALASVIKGLEDELSIAKRQFAQYQDLYSNQNPALAKRARKSLKEKMEVLISTIDGKADYIYSLYDVVEGQKQQGQWMGDEKLEAALQSMGTEIAWEGIRSNSETQRSCSTSRSRRSS